MLQAYGHNIDYIISEGTMLSRIGEDKAWPWYPKYADKPEPDGIFAFSLLHKKFTLTDIQQVYELILGKELLTPAFRRKIANYVIATDEFTENAGHRPSRLYMKRDDGDEKNTGVLE